MSWWVPLLLLGFSSTFWWTIGLLRFVCEAPSRARRGRATAPAWSASDVAILIPAHNEEVCIAATIRSALRLLPASGVHVVADGCTDRTASIARSFGVGVLELSPARGKAGGIEAAVSHFRFRERFAAVLITDADTELSPSYLTHGLALLADPEMSALAGYAYSSWRPHTLSWAGRILVAYRARLYAAMQALKYGQTWRYTNVTPIVPGFASMYRTDVLEKMDLNPPGLVIEDFNMTFELRRKRLGKVAFGTRPCATAQDPDNLRDYFKQVTRWSLGFFQTLRRHGLWMSGFSLALAVFVVEVLVAGAVVVLIALGLVLAAVALWVGDPASAPPLLAWPLTTASSMLTPINVLLFVLLPDYLVTVAAAWWLRRPSLLVYGVGFLAMRLVDAVALFWSLRKLVGSTSNGRWTSPNRRAESPVDTIGPVPDGGADRAAAAAVHDRGGAGEESAEEGEARSDRRVVQRDGLWLAVATGLSAVLLSVGAVAAEVALVLLIVAVPVGLGLTATGGRASALTRVAAALRSRRRSAGDAQDPAVRAGSAQVAGSSPPSRQNDTPASP